MSHGYTRIIAGPLLGLLCMRAPAAHSKEHGLQATVSPTDGSYSIGASGLDSPVLHAGVAVELDGRWLNSTQYPQRSIVKSTAADDLGTATEWTVTCSGLSSQPSLVYRLRTYPDKPFGDIQVDVLNTTSQTIDLMNYVPEDRQPSVFFLKDRQSVLTIFNWTDKPRTHVIPLTDLGLPGNRQYNAVDVFDSAILPAKKSDSLTVIQAPHSVRLFKLVDTSIAAETPSIKAQHPTQIDAGMQATFSAQPSNPGQAVASYRWDFGDGTEQPGAETRHAYTHAGNYTVTVTALGLNGLTSQDNFALTVTGYVPTQFAPDEILRFEGHP